MPDIKIPNVDFEKAASDINEAVKEGAYVAVGLGVLGFQRAQVQRVELMKQIETQLGQLPAQFEGVLTVAREQANSARSQLTEQFADLAKAVEDAVSPAIGQLTKLPVEIPQADAVRSQITELAKAVDHRVAPARQQLDGQLDRIQDSLPAPARGVFQSVRSAAHTNELVLRAAIGLD